MEAIKTAVQCGLGAAFVSACAIQKELDLGLVARVDIAGVRLARGVLLVSNPHRVQPRPTFQVLSQCDPGTMLDQASVVMTFRVCPKLMDENSCRLLDLLYRCIAASLCMSHMQRSMRRAQISDRLCAPGWHEIF